MGKSEGMKVEVMNEELCGEEGSLCSRLLMLNPREEIMVGIFQGERGIDIQHPNVVMQQRVTPPR